MKIFSTFFILVSLVIVSLTIISSSILQINAERPPIDYLLLNDTKTMTSSQFEKAIADFHSWFSDNYAGTLQVKLRPSEDMRLGVEATARVREGQPYLTVPLRLCIDPTTLSGPDAPEVFKSFWPWLKSRRDAPSNHVQLLLAVFLIYGRWVVPKQTFWAPYIELLPRRMDTPEHTFTDNDINVFLEGFPRFQQKIREARKRRDIEFYWLRDNVQKNPKFAEILPKKIFTRPRWSWAMAILNTRMIWWEGGPHLVPMLDMINCGIHVSNTKNTVHATVREGDGAVTRAAYPMQKGEEIFENYGQSNSYYFLNHGFFLAFNPHDCYYITVPRPERELTRKALFLTGAKIEDGDQLCTNLADQRKMEIIFELARIYTLPDKVLETAIAKRLLPTRDTDKQIRRTIRWIGKRLAEKQQEIGKTQQKYSGREQEPEDAPHNQFISDYTESIGLPIDDALVELRSRVKKLTERIKIREAKRAREELEAKKKAAEETASVVVDEGDEDPNLPSLVKSANEKRGPDGNDAANAFDDADDKLLTSSMRSRIGSSQRSNANNQRRGGAGNNRNNNNNKKSAPSSSGRSTLNKIDDDF